MEAGPFYQVGGTLPKRTPLYVQRKADGELFRSLQAGEFCYVLNSRQMGKSSLQVRVMARLEEEGFACAAIDLSDLGNASVSPEQWYGGTAFKLASSLELMSATEFAAWWRDRDTLAPVQRLGELIDRAVCDFSAGKLCQRPTSNVAIFVDEIDSVLGLARFTDDFFALIRSCYNRRAREPRYRHLTFALFGVATPADLIADPDRTPFNIGRAIELRGFRLEEARPLLSGFADRVAEPQLALQEILNWTAGQPFLTQKLCDLLRQQLEMGRSNGRGAVGESANVEEIVRSCVLENWEMQDNPEHLRTIRDRLLRNEKRAGRLLGLYRQVLLGRGGVPADDSREQAELRLCGIAIERAGRLVPHNAIYATIFDEAWIDRQLDRLRPYGVAIAAWSAAEKRDSSYLLRDRALLDALEWSSDKHLSALDYQFLSASQEAEFARLQQREQQRLVEIEQLRREKELLAALGQEQQQRERAELQLQRERQRRNAWLVGAALSALALLSGIFWVKLAIGEQNARLNSLSLFAEALLDSNRQLDALVEAMRAGRVLQRSVAPSASARIRVLTALHDSLHGLRERNRLAGHARSVLAVALSPDGNALVSGGDDGAVVLWGRDGRELDRWRGNGDSIRAVTFRSNGRTIAAVSYDGTLKLWQVAGSREIEGDGRIPKLVLQRSIASEQGKLNDVAFAPDDSAIATAGSDGTVRLWNLQGELLQSIAAHQGWVQSVAFSPDSDLLASSSSDGTVKLWNRYGTRIATLSGHKGSVYVTRWSPEGDRLASAGADGTVRLWHRYGEEIAVLESRGSRIWSLDWSRDGELLASVGADRAVRLWRSRQGTLERVLWGHSSTVFDASFGPDGDTLATASADQTIRLWSARGRPSPQFSIGEGLQAVLYSNDGDSLAALRHGGEILLWPGGRYWQRALEGPEGVIAGDWSPDGKTFALATERGTIVLLSLDGKERKTLRAHKSGSRSVRFSRDGRAIASAGEDGTIKVWTRDGELQRTLPGDSETSSWGSSDRDRYRIRPRSDRAGHRGSVNTVAFSPDGRTIASGGSDQTIRLWQWQDGKLLQTLEGHDSRVWDVRFSPDGRTIASASADGVVRLWQRNGLPLSILRHAGAVSSLSFSPDSQTLASASWDGTVRLWQRDGTLLKTFSGHRGEVQSVQFHPKGNTIVSGTRSGEILLWDLELSKLLVAACDWARDYLQNSRDVAQRDRRLCSF